MPVTIQPTKTAFTPASTQQTQNTPKNQFKSRVKNIALLLLQAAQSKYTVGGSAALAAAGASAWSASQSKTGAHALCRLQHALPGFPKPQREISITSLGSNSKFDGIELLILDDPQSSSDPHKDWMSYVANTNLNPCGEAKTSLLREGVPAEFCEVPALFEAIAKMANPPEVISMSLGVTPARVFESRTLGKINHHFVEKHGAQMTKWLQKDKEFFKELLFERATETTQNWNALLTQHCNGRTNTLEQELVSAYTALVNSGVTVVLAAGNDGGVANQFEDHDLKIPDGLYKSMYYMDGSHLPDGVIVVGASETNSKGKIAAAKYSNPSSAVDVAANGKDVEITKEGLTNWGTSVAVPQVAALVANILLINPDLTPAQLEKIITSTATPVANESQRLGAGIINPAKAYALAQTFPQKRKAA